MLFHSPSAPSWVIAFLGNPGPQYEKTRHNAGFMTGDLFAAAHSVRIDRLRFRALTGQCMIGDQQVLLMKPQTFMNLSGEAVAQALRFYKISPDHLIVVSDEMALEPGCIRIRVKGSAGGHNGLKNIIACIGTDAFPRIRIGTGTPPHPDYPVTEWVIGKIGSDDLKRIQAAAQRASDALECYIRQGPEKAMSLYNRQA